MTKIELKVVRALINLAHSCEDENLLLSKVEEKIKINYNVTLMQHQFAFVCSTENIVRIIAGRYLQLARLGQEKRKKVQVEIVQFQLNLVAGAPTVQQITALVCGYFHTSTASVRGRSKFHRHILPRQIIYYISSYRTNHSLKEIGNYMGGRDHSTVIKGRNKILGIESARDPLNRALWLKVQEIEKMLPKKPRPFQLQNITSGIYPQFKKD